MKQDLHKAIAILVMLAVTFVPALYARAEDGGEAQKDALAAGRAALDDGLYTLAEKYFTTYIDEAPKGEAKAEGVLWLARSLYGQARYDEAVELLDRRTRWARKTRVETGFVFWKAMAQFESGAYEDALDTLKTSSKASSNDPYLRQALRLRAKCYVKLGNVNKAAKTFEQFQAEHPEAAEAAENLLDWAGTLIEMENRKEAQKILEKLVEQYGESESADMGRLWLGQLQAESQQGKRAEKTFGALAGREGAATDLRARAWYGIAGVYEGRDKLTEALAAVESGEKLAQTQERKTEGQVRRARLLVNLGRMEEGVALLHEWIAANPQNPYAAKAQLDLGSTLLDRGDYEEAAQEYQRYLDAFSDDEGRAKALLGKGWCLFELERYVEAGVAFEKAFALSKSGGDRREALFKAADSYFAREQYKQAREKYLEITSTFPGTPLAPQALFQAAEALARMGEQDEARKEFRAIEDAYPDNPFAEQSAIRVALLREELGDWKRAQRTYKRAMDTYPNGLFYVRALHGRGLIRYRLGSFDKALENFERIIAEFPDSEFAEQAFYMRGWCLYLMGKSEESLDVCRKFIEKYPSSAWAPDVLFWLAEYHFNHGGYAEAEQRFLELAGTYSDGPLSDDALFWAGRAAASQKQYLRAIEHFNKLTQSYPDSAKLAEARFAQGDALSELGEFSGAILAFEEVIKNFSSSYLADLARGRIGDCQFTLGSEDPERYEEALKSYAAVLERPNVSADLKLQAEYKIGRCKEKLGRPEQAVENYMNVVYGYLMNQEKGEPGGTLWFTRAAFNAASIKESEGKLREAVNIYRRVVDAGIPAAAEAQQRIQKIRIEHWFLL